MFAEPHITSAQLVRPRRVAVRSLFLVLLAIALSFVSARLVTAQIVTDSVQTTEEAAPVDEAEDHAESSADDHQDADHEAAGAHGDEGHGPTPPLWLVVPFGVLLIMIATGPLFFAHHWHHHYPKYAIGLGAIVAGYYILGLHSPTPVLHAVQEYIAFIALVASLFIAASGIYVKVNAKGVPLTNVILLFCASVIANFIATTGAAMLFIRAYMRLNTNRIRPYHIVFFIFLVANVGGALTPIGDPPLFLGFLRGVPFFWTLAHVWYIWLPTTILLLIIFFVIDSRNKERAPDPDPSLPTLKIEGSSSFIWILVIIVSVFIDPNVL